VCKESIKPRQSDGLHDVVRVLADSYILPEMVTNFKVCEQWNPALYTDSEGKNPNENIAKIND
jgi:hypothetical protein